jgi:TonB family protein
MRKFEQLLQLTEDGEIRNDTLISELRLLASGFLDLAKASTPADAAKPTATATMGSVPAPSPKTVPSQGPATNPSPAPTTTSAVPARSTDPGAAPAAAVVTPPVPVRQDLPRWVPYDNATRQAEYRGAIKVTISADGKVQAAEIVTPTDRTYDRQLLNAARSWLYEPAKRDGVPIASEKIVAVYLRPR